MPLFVGTIEPDSGGKSPLWNWIESIPSPNHQRRPLPFSSVWFFFYGNNNPLLTTKCCILLLFKYSVHKKNNLMLICWFIKKNFLKSLRNLLEKFSYSDTDFKAMVQYGRRGRKSFSCLKLANSLTAKKLCTTIHLVTHPANWVW